MRTLVTGATGFVGSHLAEALRRRGDEVTALARSAAKAAVLAPLGVRVVPGDLHDRAALQLAVEGQEVVYHVAGVVAARSEAEFMAANRDGTRNVIEAAERAGDRPRWCSCPRWPPAGPPSRAARSGATSAPAGHRLRPEQAGRRGRPSPPARSPGHRPARRWSTARATGKCSRCSAWRGSGSRPCSATGPRSCPPCTAPIWPTRLIAAGTSAAPRSAAPTTPAIPRSSPAPSWRGPWAAAMGRSPAVIRVPRRSAAACSC